MHNRLPSKETVQRLRERYPEGTRVELISMDDPRTTLRPGDRGSVSFVDDTGTLHTDWDNGSTLGIVYGVDSVRKIEKEGYKDGAAFFRDAAVSYGTEEALGIGGRYLGMQLQLEQSRDEKQFCRELFGAMFEAAAQKTDPVKLVYPYDLPTADKRMEVSLFRESRKRNAECAEAIDKTVNESCYEPNHYNLDLAALKVVHDFGFHRVNLVLARNVQAREYDGRFSDDSKSWARGFSVPKAALQGAVLNAHPILLESLTQHVRKLYEAVGAERFALPGRSESGEKVNGYEVVRSISFDDRRGFAIGLNPEAGSPFVSWMYTQENGARDFHQGYYADSLRGAADNYVARVISHMSEGEVREGERGVMAQLRDAHNATSETKDQSPHSHKRGKGDTAR